MSKKMSTVKTECGIEVYTHDIYMYSDEYVDQEMDGDRSAVTPEMFLDMIFYISDRIQKPGHDDIVLLDNIFDVYVRLCARYKVLPTLETFGFLVKINRTTFTSWANGEYRSSTGHSDTVQKWKDICKSFVINKLHNQNGSNINLIFAAKVVHGLYEQAPAAVEKEPRKYLTADELPKLGNFNSRELSDK